MKLFKKKKKEADGLRATLTSIDEMHAMRVSLLPAARKAAVFLSYDEEEAALLFDLLHSEMEELMHLNTKDRLSKEPLFDQEQRDYLHRAMQFCAEQLKALAKYAKVGDIEG